MDISTLPSEILRTNPLLQTPSEAEIKSHERKALLWKIAAIASVVVITILAALTLYLVSVHIPDYMPMILSSMSIPVPWLATKAFRFFLDKSREHRAWLDETKNLMDKVHTLEAMSNEELKSVHEAFGTTPLSKKTKEALRDSHNKDNRDLDSGYRVLIPLIARLQIASEEQNSLLNSPVYKVAKKAWRKHFILPQASLEQVQKLKDSSAKELIGTDNMRLECLSDLKNVELKVDYLRVYKLFLTHVLSNPLSSGELGVIGELASRSPFDTSLSPNDPAAIFYPHGSITDAISPQVFESTHSEMLLNPISSVIGSYLQDHIDELPLSKDKKQELIEYLPADEDASAHISLPPSLDKKRAKEEEESYAPAINLFNTNLIPRNILEQFKQATIETFKKLCKLDCIKHEETFSDAIMQALSSLMLYHKDAQPFLDFYTNLQLERRFYNGNRLFSWIHSLANMEDKKTLKEKLSPLPIAKEIKKAIARRIEEIKAKVLSLKPSLEEKSYPPQAIDSILSEKRTYKLRRDPLLTSIATHLWNEHAL